MVKVEVAPEAAAIRVYPNVDHIHAGSLGGDWLDPANLVSACTPCNERKSNRLGWKATTYKPDGWHGLTECYRSLAQRTGTIRRCHLDWVKALGI